MNRRRFLQAGAALAGAAVIGLPAVKHVVNIGMDAQGGIQLSFDPPMVIRSGESLTLSWFGSVKNVRIGGTRASDCVLRELTA